MTVANRCAVFLDRDGTIIRDTYYIKDPQQVQLLSGVGEALAKLKRRDYFLVVVSNQSGIGRGLVTNEQAERVHRRVIDSLEDNNVQVDAVYYCPHTPEEQCRCRKPSPTMLLRAANAFSLNLECSYMVGDKPSDIEAGRRAGCRTILLVNDLYPKKPDPEPDYIAIDWSEVLRYILSDIGVPM
jgi:histidinol-phosphate phosphatase family protein